MVHVRAASRSPFATCRVTKPSCSPPANLTSADTLQDSLLLSVSLTFAAACSLIQHWMDRGMLDEAGKQAAEDSLAAHPVTAEAAASVKHFLQNFLKAPILTAAEQT